VTYRLVRVALTAVLGALAALAFAPVFGGFGAAFLTAVLSAVAVAALAGALAAGVSRLPAAVAALIGLAGVVAVACAVTGTGAAVAQGPWHLLTGALPTDPAGPPLAAAAVFAGWTTLAGMLLAAYGRAALAPAVPPLIALVVALSLGAAVPPPPAWLAPAVIVVVAGLLFAGVPRERSRLRRLAAPAVVVVLAVLAAVALGPAMPGAGAREPADLRALVAAPVLPRSGVSPLQQYLALRNGKLPLKLTGTVSRPGTPLRLATLTEFDGTYWTVAGDFRLAGTRLPGTGGGAGDALVTERVTVDAGELDWLVTAGRAERVDVPGLGVNEETGDLAVPVGGSSPVGYTATSRVPATSVDDLLADDPAPPAAPLSPQLPATVRSFVDTSVRDEPDGPDQLLALYQALRTFHDDQAAEAPGGHGYFQIERLLTTKRGTSEQFASAFAVMARFLGYDSRVVMGLRPRYTGDAFEATGKDVAAWAEVRLAGSGWVPVDPTPRDNPIGTRPGAPPVGSKASAADDPLSEADQPQGSLPDPGQPDGEAAGGTGGASPGVLTVAVGVVIVLFALLLPASVARVVRRTRRRRAPSDRRAILGAWWETAERMRAAGLPVTAAMTTGEVIAAAPPPVRAAGLADLARMVDDAAYAPDEPPAGLRDAAWRTAGEVDRRLRAGLRPARRFAVLLNLPSRRRG
jgi:protein-glutamine gamma-glutamyltransferase